MAEKARLACKDKQFLQNCIENLEAEMNDEENDTDF